MARQQGEMLGALCTAGAVPPREAGLRGLADQAWQQYSRAQDLLRQGNFGGYGEEIKRLEGTLKTLRERAR